MRRISVLIGIVSILAGCSSAETTNTLAGFPQSIDGLSQKQKNDILEFRYQDLSEADQQLWIDVYAAEYRVGFEKASQSSDIKLIRSLGLASTDTHHMTVIAPSDFSSLNPEDLKARQCVKETLIWAMKNGLTLQTDFRNPNDDTHMQIKLNQETCNL